MVIHEKMDVYHERVLLQRPDNGKLQRMNKIWPSLNFPNNFHRFPKSIEPLFD